MAFLQHRGRRITKYFNKSTSANEALLKEQRKLNYTQPKKVRPDVRQRWNSTYLLFSRLLFLKTPLILQGSTCGRIRKRSLSGEEWELMPEVVKLLRPLYDVTVVVSGDTYPTLALVHYLLSGSHCLLLVLSLFQLLWG